MIKAAERAGVLLSVFHNRRWDSDYLTVKNALQKGLLGEPWVIESSVVNFRTPPPPGQPLPWRMQARYGGGIIRDWGAHLLDQAIQLLGNDIRSVYADFQYRWPRIDVESAAVCWIRFNDGVRFRVEVGGISKIGRPRWYVRGSRGALVIDSLDPQEAELKRQVVISGTEQARIPGEKCRFESDVPGAELENPAGDYLAYYIKHRRSAFGGCALGGNSRKRAGFIAASGSHRGLGCLRDGDQLPVIRPLLLPLSQLS